MMDDSFSSTTPPMASADRRPSEDSYYIDSYLSKTYVPLSNLPTPPLSAHSNGSTVEEIPKLDLADGLDPTLLGPAIHLKNLIPSSVSLLDPSTHLVHSILVRAELPLPTIALAVCILDSLNSRFALSWRQSCPLTNTKGSTSQRPHIDSIRHEVIILAALIISVKFLDDQESTTQSYAEDWGAGRWTCDQINATQYCIMENLGYRILPLWTEQLICEAMEDMEIAGRYGGGLAGTLPMQAGDLDLKATISENAIWSKNRLVAPDETPMSENRRRMADVAPERRRAFGVQNGTISEKLELSRVTITETIPTYYEPVLGV